MGESAERYNRIASAFASTLRRVPDTSWDTRSPCDDWTAFDVAAHVIATHRRILAMLDERDTGAPTSVADLLPAFAEASDGVRSALADQDIAHREVQAFSGPVEFESLIDRLLCTDTLLHTWDLARAAGIDDSLDVEGVRVAHENLLSMGEGIRRPGGFGAPLHVPADADPQTALLLFAGRQP